MMNTLHDPHSILSLEESKESFTLSFKGKVIFDHSPSEPCIDLGRGKGKFRFFYGLFKIRDRLKVRKICRRFTVMENTPEQVVVRFEDDLILTAKIISDRLHVGFQTEGDWNRLSLFWKAEPNEKVYGGGEQFSRLNLRGRNLPIWVQEPGLGRKFDLLTIFFELKMRYGGRWFSTYFPQPTFVFTSGMFLHSNSSAYSEGLFKKSRRHGLRVWSIPKSLVFGVESNPLSLMDSLTSLLGRQPPLPSWCYDGLWLGAQGGKEISYAKLESVRNAGVKVGALWCQDWQGIRITSFGKQLMWDWSYDKTLYPELSEYIRQLESEGVKYLGYINPFLALEGELYKEASAKNYCVKDRAGNDYLVTITTFPVAMLDLTNPECRKWIKDVIKNNMIGLGLAGWMADFGEYIPVDAVFHDGSDGLTYHNSYCPEWARINQEAIVEAGRDGSAVFFMRAGYTGSTRFSPSFWNGDQLVNWSRGQGFPTVIPASLSLGFTGVGSVHSDLGGFTTVLWLRRSRELVLRWAEQAAFSQTMRSHEGNRPHVGVQLHEDEKILAQLKKMTGVFVALKPYHQALSEEYQNTGLPPIRHAWMHYPQDHAVHRRSGWYTYLYGRELFVAPVLRPGRRSRRLYLPSDQWIHLWSGREYVGGRYVTVPAPIGEPAVFYRKSSKWHRLFEGLKNC